MKIVKTITAAAMCFAVSLSAQQLRELAFQVAMPAKESPKLDGVLDDACWKTAPKHSDYYDYLSENPRRVTNTKTDCMIVYDDKGVYTGIVNWEDQPERLRQNCTKNFQNNIWTDDCGEIYYDPDAAGIGYYKFVVNSLGKFDTAWRMDSANMDEDWTALGVECAAKVFADRWEVELFIPWSAFGNRPAPQAGEIWTFNHSRFRFGALGWGKGFSTSAPGASGVSANKFGYLYFSDGTAPDANKVLSILEERLNVNWGISINGKVYVHDLNGTNESDLDADKKALEKEFLERAEVIKPRLDELKNPSLLSSFAKTRTAFTNEQALYDGSFASVKLFREFLGSMQAMDYEIKILDLAATNTVAEPIQMPLAGRYDLNPPKEYDGHNGWARHNTIKNAYVTPHLDWCGKFTGRKPLVLFMTGFNGTWRDMIELDQRNDIEPLYFPGNFGATGVYQDPLSHGTFLDKQAQFETLLAKNPDVVVLNGFSWNSIPARYRYEILRRVRDDGMGLALLWNSANVPDAVTKKLEFDSVARQILASRVPYAQLPGASKPSRLAPGLSPTEAKISCWHMGKGRIVNGDIQSPGSWSLNWKGGYEARGVFQMNAIRWAAGEDPLSSVSFGSGEEKDEFSSRAPFMAFEINTAKSGINSVRYRLRTTENKVLKDENLKLASGRNVLSVDLRDVAAGDYYLDLIPEKKGFLGGTLCDFPAVHPFSKIPSVGTFMINSSNTTVIAEGSRANLPVTWERGMTEDGTLDWKVYDTYKQLRIKGTVPVRKGSRSVNVQFDGANFPTLSGFIQATLKSARGTPIAEKRKTVFFPNHRFPDYTMIIWESMNEQNMTELFAPQCVDVMGYENHLGESGNLSAAFNGRAVPHITRVTLGGGKGGTTWDRFPWPTATNDAQKAEFKELAKDVNIYRPQIRELFERGFTPRVEKCAPYGVCVYNLGDECHYSSDIGFGDEMDEGFYRDYIKNRYGTIEKFNAIHGTQHKDFSYVVHMTTAEAKKAGDWTSWFDQISYAAKMYSDTFQLCRSVIKKYDPKGRVGAEGSPAGNIDETIKNLEFWGPYGNFEMNEVLRSIAPDRVRGMWWGGYLRSPRDGFPGHQWEYLLTGHANGDQWFAAMSGSTEGAFAGDFTLYPYVQKLHPHHAQLKHGLASFMIRTPLRKDPYAIYYSWSSGCAATLSDEFPVPMEGCHSLVLFSYRHGLESTFVTPGSLKNLEGRKLLFLPGVCALSDDEVTALKAFVKRGGKLYADSEPGVLDGFLARRAEAPLKGMWTKYERTATDDDLLKIVAEVGIKQIESVEGVDWSRTILRTRVLGDMKCTGFTCLVKNLGNDITLNLGSDGYIYEVDTGYVGQGDKVEIKSLDRPFKLYAQFKEEQKAPAYTLSKTEINAGEFVSFETKDLRDGGVYRLAVFGPDGKVIPNREMIFTVEKKTAPKKTFQFPYSDNGLYKVVLRDIATALETEVSVTVSGL